MVSVVLTTDQGKFEASGTIFGNQFLRLVRLNEFHFEAYLDGLLLIYRHRDVPGLIGFIEPSSASTTSTSLRWLWVASNSTRRRLGGGVEPGYRTI